MIEPLSLLFLIPLIFLAGFIYSIAITAASGLAITLFVRTQNNDMGKREGFLITSLTWVVFSLFGMLPFVFGNTHMSVSDAFFEILKKAAFAFITYICGNFRNVLLRIEQIVLCHLHPYINYILMECH